MCKETGLGEVMAAGVASLDLIFCPPCALSLLCYSYSHFAEGLQYSKCFKILLGTLEE